MAWEPVELYYDNRLTSTAIAADYAHANYPVTNIITRVNGPRWKSTSQLPQKIKHPAVSVVADYCLLFGHNLSGSMLSLEHDSTIDDFSNSSLAATWGTSIAGVGTVTETTSLAITAAAAADAAMLIEAATYSKTTARRIRTRSKVTTASADVTLQGLAYRTTVSTEATFISDILCQCFITSTGKIRARYYDTAAAGFKYYNAATGLWDTTSTNDFYAGALGTEYYVDLVNDGTSFRFIVYLQSTGAVLAKTTWIAFSAARASGTGSLTWYLGDPYNDVGTCAMTVYLAELWSVVFAEDIANNKAILRTFNSTTKSNWYLFIVPNAVTPFIAVFQLGEKTVLDHADAMNPYDLNNHGIVNVSDTGIVQGIHDKFIEYMLQMKFLSADAALLAKIRTWEETVGLGLFGMRWDPGDHATDVRVLRKKDGKFSAPLKQYGAYADVTMDLIGVKE